MATTPVHRRAGRTSTLVVAASLTLALAACGDDPAPSAGSTVDPPTSTTGSSTTVDDTSTTSTPGPSGQTAAAIADLAAHLGVDPADIVVVSSEAVTWRDGSLGCPQPGFMYTQVLTEGVRIVLEVDGSRHHYHGGAAGDPTRCTTPQEPYEVG